MITQKNCIQTINSPQLLKMRQLHTRILIVALVFLALISEPKLDWGATRICIFGLGYLLLIIGTLGRIYCSIYIGGHKGKKIVCEGPFGIVRNPLYVCSFIAITGVGLQTGTIVMLVIILGIFCMYYPMVVAKEESFLMHHWGDSYAAYAQKVPRWIPSPKLWTEPTAVDSRPRGIRHALFDAFAFFLSTPIIVICWVLHANKILPVWLFLP